ncbi:MAG: DHHA1 domain-containing protein [Nanobdellota archaeon]
MDEKELIKDIRTKIKTAVRPLFLFDNDPDGLSSFLILYRMVRTGKGIPVKSSIVKESLTKKVNDYSPDLVVILDKAKVEEEFIDAVRAEIVWIDHHDVQEAKGTTYLNPLVKNPNDNTATSYFAYKISEKDAWLAVTGIVSDWQLPPEDVLETFQQEHPGFLPADTNTAQQALFETKVGELAKIFSFNLKGSKKDVLSSMKMLTRISKPEELLEKQHSQAKLIMKRFEKHNHEYNKLKEQLHINEKDPLLLFTYNDQQNSYTTDLSNELLYTYPDKMIIIARKSNGSYKCSLRSSKLHVHDILEQALLTVNNSTGGGHTHACGAIIAEEEFNTMIETIREQLPKQKA